MTKSVINKGDKYNRLTILSESDQKGYDRYFNCECICGNIKTIRIDHIKSGRTKSCGCLVKNNSFRTHGLSNQKIYKVYDSMKERCNNKNSKSYKYYGGRGIKCEWNSFEDFYRDMGDLYVEGLQIDRIDNDGNYCKKNCKWSTRKENCRNRRNTIYIGSIPLIQYCEENNIDYNQYRYLYRKSKLIV